MIHNYSERSVSDLFFFGMLRGFIGRVLLAGVRTAVDAFVKQAPQFDDLTMLGLKYNGPQVSTETEEQ